MVSVFRIVLPTCAAKVVSERKARSKSEPNGQACPELQIDRAMRL